MKLALCIALLAAPGFAQENLFEYLQTHAGIVSGVSVANGEKTEFLSVSLNDDFEIKPRFHGFVGLALFSRQRVSGASEARAGIPLSLDDLALYSSGEGIGGAYFKWTEKVGLECRGGITFEMTGILGKAGDPVDGSKFLGACGVRLTGGPGWLSVLAGHYGTVTSGAAFWFVPTLVFAGEFRLPSSMAFLVDVAAGRDRATQSAVTSSRFAVRKQF